jgi:hypothetical protein
MITGFGAIGDLQAVNGAAGDTAVQRLGDDPVYGKGGTGEMAAHSTLKRVYTERQGYAEHGT